MSIDIIKSKKFYLSALSTLIIPIGYIGYNRYSKYKRSQVESSISSQSPFTPHFLSEFQESSQIESPSQIQLNLDFNKEFLSQIHILESTAVSQKSLSIINYLENQKQLNRLKRKPNKIK